MTLFERIQEIQNWRDFRNSEYRRTKDWHHAQKIEPPDHLQKTTEEVRDIFVAASYGTLSADTDCIVRFYTDEAELVMETENEFANRVYGLPISILNCAFPQEAAVKYGLDRRKKQVLQDKQQLLYELSFIDAELTKLNELYSKLEALDDPA